MSATHPSRADEVYQQLKHDIADFRLVPGDRVTETQISERLRVSRTPVRQALFRLQQEGYVDVLFRSGWLVRPFDFDKFDQLYDLRRVIEVEAVNRLCHDDPRTDRTVLRSLARIWLVPLDARSKDQQQVAEWDEAFHQQLVAATGNAEMLRVHQEVTERIRIVRRLDFTYQNRIDVTYTEHGQIVLAVLEGRSDDAVRLLRAHIESSQTEVRHITLHQVQQARAAGKRGAVPLTTSELHASRSN